MTPNRDANAARGAEIRIGFRSGGPAKIAAAVVRGSRALAAVIAAIVSPLFIILLGIGFFVAAFVSNLLLTLFGHPIKVLLELFEAIRESRANILVISSPGWTLHRWVDFLLSKKSVNQIFEPIIADMQVEYLDALAEGRHAKAKWVLVRGYSSFWYAFVLHTVGSLVRVAVQVWKFFK